MTVWPVRLNKKSTNRARQQVGCSAMKLDSKTIMINGSNDDNSKQNKSQKWYKVVPPPVINGL